MTNNGSSLGPMFLAAVILAATACPVQAAALEDAAASARCKALADADFSGVTDAPTQVLSIEVQPAKEKLPQLCRVVGNVNPQVGFELSLPLANWNGKFIHMGSGGHGGTMST